MTAESGTGVVHQAPGFGEDDFRVCQHYGIIKKGDSVVCPVDASGLFTEEVVDFKGQYVKVSSKLHTERRILICILTFLSGSTSMYEQC